MLNDTNITKDDNGIHVGMPQKVITDAIHVRCTPILLHGRAGQKVS